MENGYHWPAICAFRKNHAEIFDLLIRGYYAKRVETEENFNIEYHFGWDFAVPRMIETAIQENLDQSLRVIKKYLPNRQDVLTDNIEPWP
jgi:hypothetical protein